MIPFDQRSYILFDLDGTVIDSQEGIFNSLHYAFSKLGMDTPGEDILSQFIGPSIGATFIRLFGFSKEQADEGVRIYREYYRAKGLLECSAYPGIAELLDALHAQGKHTALATKKPGMFAIEILKALDLYHRFDTIQGASPEDSSEHKGYVVETALRELGVEDKSKAVLIGDTWYDCVGAAQAGIDCIGVLYGFGDPKKMEEHGAAAFAATMEDLAHLLGVNPESLSSV